MENSIEQRTTEWHLQRLGKFTASEIHKLMGIKGLGETGKSYAIEKAIEELFGETNESFISYDMQRGIDLEPLAFAKVKELKSLQFLEVDNCGFIEFGEHSGASPDGIIGLNTNLEIKCPKAETFFKLVATNEVDKKYFYQMQMQMLCLNSFETCFFNYCIIEGIEYWHEITVKRDETVCNLITERILEAVEIKNEFINQLNINKQW